MNLQKEDKDFLESAVIELADYLKSSVYDWPLSNTMVRLTPGRILFSLKRVSKNINIASMDSDALDRKINELIGQYSHAWVQKIELEYPRRLRVWENFISDYTEEGLDKSYLVQIINRVILRLLEGESPITAARFLDRVSIVDEKYRRMVRYGDFIWDKPLESVFPESDYWFLYYHPAKG